MSIVQGGPGFPILADAVFEYITTGITTGIKVPNEQLPIQLKCLVTEVATICKRACLTSVTNLYTRLKLQAQISSCVIFLKTKRMNFFCWRLVVT